MATNHRTSDGPDSIWDQLQFRMLFMMVFAWFISVAILKSLRFKGLAARRAAGKRARRSAYSLTPYAFMRI
jgi:hypothetical protein